MDKIRKLINRPEGYGALSGISYFVLSCLLLKQPFSNALFMGSVMGIAAGFGISRRYKKEGKNYFVQNVENNKYHVTRIFNRRLKKTELPDKQAYDEFLEYLDAVEKIQRENTGNRGILLLCILGFFFVTITAADGFNWHSCFFGAFLLLYGYIFFIQGRQKLSKVAILRERIAHEQSAENKVQ